MLKTTWEQARGTVETRFGGLERDAEAVDRRVTKLTEETIPEMRTSIALLQLKAGMFGALAGAIPVAIMLGLQYLTRM